MKNLRVAARYAKSLIDLAQDGNKLEVIKGDMDTLQQMLKSRDFYLLLKSPIIKPAKKRSVLDAVLAQAKFDDLTLAFARILVDKGRESNLPEVVGAFIDQYKVIKQITSVKVTSAAELSEVELADIKSKLITSGNTEADIDIETVIDPSLIGGFILEYDGKVYDASVAYKLTELRREFKKPNVYVGQLTD
jgi:F-type H+-transporting ATPase subunit delta